MRRASISRGWFMRALAILAYRDVVPLHKRVRRITSQRWQNLPRRNPYCTCGRSRDCAGGDVIESEPDMQVVGETVGRNREHKLKASESVLGTTHLQPKT